MRLRRFRLRTLMVAVAVVGLACGAIVVTPGAVPEPSGLALLGLAAAGTLLYARRRRARAKWAAKARRFGA